MHIAIAAISEPSAADCLFLIHDKERAISNPPSPALHAFLHEFAAAADAGTMKRMDAASAPADARCRRLAAIGIGMKSRKHWPESERYRGAAHEAYAYCREGGWTKAAFDLRGEDGHAAAPWIAQGLALGAYAFQKYKQKPSDFAERFSALMLVAPARLAEARKAVRAALGVAECANWARSLVDLPGSLAVPEYLASETKAMAQAAGLECEIWDEKRLRKEGYNGLLTVGRGGESPPRMIVLRHRPARAGKTPHLGLVGKGLTFDTGGLCLKGGSDMWEMICDMSGAASVAAAMRSIAEARIPIRATGVLVCAQNDIGSKATRPGDAFFAKNGTGIHVLNTDAEGRLILTDGLARIGEEGATHIVDLATLTGSCVRALGNSLSGLFCNDAEFSAQLQAVGEREGEQMWPMPLFEEYRDNLSHYRADINNIGKTANGGAIHGALFLREFVPKGAVWAHLDIAGTAFESKPWRYLGPGPRGVMVRTLAALASEMARAKA
ncbi:MAG: Cytosol aminopeptidase [candidate division BRC1 bacterium ADurb.BinA364]|nr:MAG: Cytosol aminopeptidase [candidate division BRC1 bacterium ADurb.BinA364]